MIGVGCVDIGVREKMYVSRVLDSGLITSGPVLERFENEFAQRHGKKHGLMVNSGTDALRIALASLQEFDGWGPDAEVIVPALTFIATSNVVIQNGLVPVFVDVDPDTFNIDPWRIREAITPRTRAIIPVHLFGLPCDMDAIMRIAKEYNLRVIEDSCESMGVTYRGKSVGSFGDVACFSTYAAHIITTGIGGLAITDDSEIASLMRSYANHGRDPEFLGFRDSKFLRPENYINESDHAKLIDRRFRFERIGYSSRVTQMEAALGMAQLERIDEIVLERRKNEVFLRDQLKRNPALRLQEHPLDRESACMMFPIVLNGDIERHTLMVDLERKGIETRPFFDIVGQKPYFRRYEFAENLPFSTELSKRGFYVGCHQLLSPSDLWQVVDAMADILAPRKAVA